MEAATLRHGQNQPPNLSPFSSGRRRSSDSNSPEFEFWMVRNPSFPQPNLVSADELFVNGVLLPLDLLSHHHDKEAEEQQQPDLNPPTDAEPEPEPDTEPCPGPQLASITTDSAPSLTASKRWRDIFKKSDKKSTSSNSLDDKDKEKDKEKKKERRSQIGVNSAELNINIWPFSRSRSAGNGGARARAAPIRKVSSAPCSRSNSSGRKWPSSPGRNGVHLGRSSPVWQVRRGSMGPKATETSGGGKKEPPTIRRNKGTAAGGSPKAKVLNLKVPMCIGYKSQLSCRSDENSAIGVVGGGGNDGGAGLSGSGGSGGGNIFNLRSLFTKKVH